ncbi:MAG: hypothetical protein ACO3B3_02410 [Cyanobium sp.]
MRQLQSPKLDLEAQYRPMVFNLGARNQDDHIKTMAFRTAGISSGCGDQIPAVGCRQRAALLARWAWRSMAMMEPSPRPLP